MSPFESEEQKVAGWLQPLADEAAPCGPDLEYDNDFLALNVAAAGKPESTFGPAEPPDWRSVVEMAEALLDRSRDLRIAVLWLRGQLHQAGYGALPVGLRLINGMLDSLWEALHPMPDPDDGDTYARVNALTALRDNEGLIGDLRESHLVQDRAVGQVTVRQALVALNQLPAVDGEASPGRDQLSGMLGAVAARQPALRQQFADAVTLSRQLISLAGDKLGDAAPDLRPLYNLANSLAGLLPAESAADSDDAGDTADGADGAVADAPGGGGGRRSLSGTVNSRDDAVRAIDMVCAYLERAEPTNPAQLFLRRGQALIGQNFLQLIKALAPEALPGVANMVGVDPSALDAVADSDSSDSY
jgi:type VI secretion system protein ImpA